MSTTRILAIQFLLTFLGCYTDTEDPFMKQTVLRPSGVVTQPNEVGELPPGTLSTGDNVMMRRQGVLEPRPAFQDFDTASGSNVVKIWPGPEEYVLFLSTSGGGGTATALSYLEQGDATAANIATPDGIDFLPGKTHLTVARDRRIMTTEAAPIVMDPEEFDGSGFTARLAGLPQPGLIYGQWTGGTSGTAVEMNKWTAACAVFKRTRDDGYVIRSAPSHVFLDANSNGGTRNLLYSVVWNQDTWDLEAGDEIEFYRALSQDTAALVDANFRLSTTYTLTGADILASLAEATDTTPDSALGDYLYTNETQDGPDKVNLMPPVSEDVATFKGATFYRSTHAWQTLSFQATGKVGTLSTAAERLSGVGQRTVTGTITAASDEITGVSDADAVGLVPGQVITGTAHFPAGTTILSVVDVGANYTITVDEVATGSSGTAFTVDDVLRIDGVSIDYAGMGDVLSGLAAAMVAGDTSVVLSAGRVDWGLDAEATPFLLLNPLPAGAAFTVTATNGQNFVPAIPALGEIGLSSTNDPRTNRLHFSKIRQPEHVPPSNFLDVGEGTILKLWATQSTLFVFCTDGIFRIDGDGDDWAVNPFDPDTVLLAPNAIDSIDNTIYALTSAGFVMIDDSSAKPQRLSAPLIGNDIRALWEQFQTAARPLPYLWGVQVAADKYRSEVWLNFNDFGSDGGEGWAQTYVWNIDTNTFLTQSEEEASAVVYHPASQSILAATSAGIRYYDTDVFMEPTIVFNTIFADDLGYLKQWNDVTLFFEDLSANVNITPQFNGVNYGSSYVLSAQSGPFEHVIAPLLDAVLSKQVRFGFAMTATGESGASWKLKGLTFRYRVAAETIRN